MEIQASIVSSHFNSRGFLESSTSKSDQTASTSSSYLGAEDHHYDHDLHVNDAAIHSSSISSSHLHGQLSFARLGLVGREKETRALDNAVNRVLSHTARSKSLSLSRAENSAPPVRALTLISGISGSGKSALAMHPKEECLQRHGFFVQGKFDLHQMDEPFSGIKSAMEQLCQQVKELPRNDVVAASSKDPRRLSTLRMLLSQGLNTTERQVLSKIIPSLFNLIEEDSGDSKPSGDDASKTSSSTTNMSLSLAHVAVTNEHIGYRAKSDRQKFALRHFIQIICEYAPLVLVVDDLQWADKASLDLMESWLMDSTIPALMIIGSYRSDLADDNLNLKSTIHAIQTNKRERAISILELPVGNLGIDSVQEMLVELLSPDDDEDVDGLADIVYKKTGGNVFFVQQYLQSLVEDYLLVFDINSMKWMWNDNTINIKSSATTNVIQLMMNKLKRSDAAQQVLPVAACLGSTFSRTELVMAIRAMSIHSGHSAFYKETFGAKHCVSESMIHECLRTCEKEGLVAAHRAASHKKQKKTSVRTSFATSGSDASGHSDKLKPAKRKSGPKNAGKKIDQHSFIHDKIQEAALALIPEGKLSELQYRVGEVLLSGLATSELNETIFSVAGLINSRLDLVPTGEQQNNRRMKIARLNYKAGQKAVECSAFLPALRYFETAISLLPHDHWESQLKDSLKIYASAAECASITSNIDKMNEYCSKIVALDCPVIKKAKAYEVLICSSFADFEREENDEDTVGLCLSVLQKFGCDFPQSKFRRTMATISGMIFMKMNSSQQTLKKIKNLPVSQKEEDAAIMKTLGRLSDASFVANPDLLPLVTSKRVQRTMKNGITPHSPPAFGFQALIVGYFMGDFQAGRKVAELAMGMFESLDNRMAMCETYANVYATVWHWTNPIEEVRDLYLEAYDIGLAVGDVQSAVWCMLHHLVNGMLTGVSLAELDAKMTTNLQLMLDCRQTNQADFLQVHLQAIRNLRGHSDHLTLLVGDIFDETEMNQSTRDESRKVTVACNRLIAAVHFGEFKVGADSTLEFFDKILGTLPGLASLYAAAFEGGLCCFEMAGRATESSTKRREYLKMANKCRKKLKEWIKKGNPNCVHTLAILNAERDRIQGKCDSAIKHFSEAVTLSQDRGFIHHEALANERLAVCLGECGNDSDARMFWDESIRLYGEWGADKKVELLRAAQQG